MIAPPAHAMMPPGNYDVLTNRYNRASWVWFVSRCAARTPLDCLDISAIPRLKFYAYYERQGAPCRRPYTLTVDVQRRFALPPGYSLPTRDTYTWDPVTLAGEINSVYDVGCFNGPPGTQFWTFALQRL